MSCDAADKFELFLTSTNLIKNKNNQNYAKGNFSVIGHNVLSDWCVCHRRPDLHGLEPSLIFSAEGVKQNALLGDTFLTKTAGNIQ